MTDSDIYKDSIETIQKNWIWSLVIGIAMILIGLASIAMPFVATFAVEIMIGWLLVGTGLIVGVHAFRAREWGGLFLQLALGILTLAIGVFLLAYPLQGALTLTLVLSIYFVMTGIFKIAHSLRIRPMAHWGWRLFSGVLSLFLGMIIWVNMPATAFWAVGLIVGIDLLFSGLSMVMLSIAVRTAPREGWYCVGGHCYSS